MNLVAIAWKSVRQRAVASTLTALSVALGVALMVAVLVISGIVSDTFSQRSVGYDLIVGPKGSDLQLVLSTIYRISPPIENLPYSYYLELKDRSAVEEAIPIALGDNTEQGGFPIVGTVSRYFELPYAYPEGEPRNFRVRGYQMNGLFDAVIGAQVARKNNWDVGTEFSILHSGAESDHVHDETFKVVGVLAATGTPNDKTVFVNLEGLYLLEGHDTPIDEARARWEKFYGKDRLAEFDAATAEYREELAEEQAGDGHHHHHHELPDEIKEVTSVLLLMRSEEDAIFFSAALKSGFQAQAINPILPMRRLTETFVGNIRKVLVVLTALIILVSGIGIFVSIYNSMADRRHEIAIMRALGAQRQTVFAIVLAESIVLCVGGGLLGLLLGHGLVYVATPYVEAQTGLLIEPLRFEMVELILIPSLIALASVVGFIPGLTAYRTDVAASLGG